jgi:hypothetical protein
MTLKYPLLAAALALAPLVAQAESSSTYRCVGKDGRKYYGSSIPPQCQGQRIEELSSSGLVLRRIDPEGEEKMRIAKEAEASKKREEDAMAKEASRRNHALLATYSSEKDVDDARARALGTNETAVKEIEKRISEIKKRQAAFAKEMEFYHEGAAKPSADKKGKAAPQVSAESPPPPKLLQDMKNAEVELTAQESLLALKKKEVDAINAKYDEDKRRYAELTSTPNKKRGAP